MKKWEKPELNLLEAIETKTTECTCNVGGGLTKKASKHPCHKTGNGWHNDSGNHTAGVENNGHVASIGCTDPNHYVDGVCICCCYDPANVPGQPQS